MVDEGRHDELLARGGLYARLHALQFKTDGPTADSAAQDAQARRRPGSAAEGPYSAPRDGSNLLCRVSSAAGSAIAAKGSNRRRPSARASAKSSISGMSGTPPIFVEQRARNQQALIAERQAWCGTRSQVGPARHQRRPQARRGPNRSRKNPALSGAWAICAIAAAAQPGASTVGVQDQHPLTLAAAATPRPGSARCA
ncbi:MAG: hypothetical protein R3D85_03880 [Paracoccaceae bacterium]